MPMAVFGGIALFAAAIYFGSGAQAVIAAGGIHKIAICDPETGKWHQNYSYDEPERMTRMPDADFADIIERIMAREDFQDRLGMAVGGISAKDMEKYPPEIIGADEWGEVFGADIYDEDGLSWDDEELYDLVSGFWDPENVEWDLSTVDYPLAEGTTLQMYVDALRGRNQ